MNSARRTGENSAVLCKIIAVALLCRRARLAEEIIKKEESKKKIE